MPLSKPHAICELFKAKWEEKFGEQYFIIKGKDHKFAKELDEVPMDEIARRLDIFLRDSWYIENTKCSLASFVKNFNIFIPTKYSQPKTYPCPECHQRYDTYEKYQDHKCLKAIAPPKEFTEALNNLAERMRVK